MFLLIRLSADKLSAHLPYVRRDRDWCGPEIKGTEERESERDNL